MPVNLAQYRVTDEIFNNHQIIVSLHYGESLYLNMSNNLFKYGSSILYFSLIFYFFFCVLFLSKGNALEINLEFCVQFFLFPTIVARVLVCFCCFLMMFK